MAIVPSKFPEADRIVEEVLQGKRVFALWPGTGTVVTVIMLHVLAISAWLGPTFFALVRSQRDRQWPWGPLLLAALAVCIATIVAPAIQLVRGAPSGYRVLRSVTGSWFTCAVVTAAGTALGWIAAPLWPYGLSALASGAAFALEHSESCLVYVVLRQRFAVKVAQRALGTER